MIRKQKIAIAVTAALLIVGALVGSGITTGSLSSNAIGDKRGGNNGRGFICSEQAIAPNSRETREYTNNVTKRDNLLTRKSRLLSDLNVANNSCKKLNGQNKRKCENGVKELKSINKDLLKINERIGEYEGCRDSVGNDTKAVLTNLPLTGFNGTPSSENIVAVSFSLLSKGKNLGISRVNAKVKAVSRVPYSDVISEVKLLFGSTPTNQTVLEAISGDYISRDGNISFNDFATEIPKNTIGVFSISLSFKKSKQEQLESMIYTVELNSSDIYVFDDSNQKVILPEMNLRGQDITIKDTSPAQLELLTPGGEGVYVYSGNNTNITWRNSDSLSSGVVISLFSADSTIKNKSFIGFIGISEPGAFEFNWDSKTICNSFEGSKGFECRDVLPGDYKIQIIDPAMNSNDELAGIDISKEAFTIRDNSMTRLFGPWVFSRQSNLVLVGDMAQFTSDIGSPLYTYTCGQDGDRVINPQNPEGHEHGTFYCTYKNTGTKTVEIIYQGKSIATKTFMVNDIKKLDE